MSETGQPDDREPVGQEQPPTASFSKSAVGPGGQIGPFRIEQELGRGGAGVVYLAHDTKLDRSVAIKSLPADLMENPKARTRFTREARVLASLNHPNIATIYEELQEAEGVGYLILEYVPGQTLAERIAGARLKLQETLTIALQIAEAVAAAHEHDVVHRDLKPGNIKITPEGKVKVLDFGLAKALGGETVDQQSTVTEPGRIIGTPAYMSPEQARGQETDKRCDIWSFGCVLYEMLTGKVPFEGETVSDTLAGILEREPDWHALPQAVPMNIQVMLRRCLEKDPRRRLRDIGDAGIEISETLTDSRSAGVVPAAAPGKPTPVGLRRMMVLAVVCVSLGAGAATVITWSLKRPITPSMPVSHFPIRLPQNQMLSESDPEIAISPDGKRLVYTGAVGNNRRLFLREFESNKLVGRELPETKDGEILCFSPDSRQIGFCAGGKLKTLFLKGGKPKELCDAYFILGATWCRDDTIFFSPSVTDGLWKIPANGGTKEQVTEPNEHEFGHWWPEALPDGEAVLFTVWNETLNEMQVAVLLRETRKWRILIPGASHARYAPTGHLLYAQFGTLMAAPFDIKQLKPKLSEARPVIEYLDQRILSHGGYAPFCFSTDGLLYYVRGGDWLARRNIVWVDRRTGDVIETLPLELGAYASPRLSPNGQSIAFTKFDSGAENIWVLDLSKGSPEKVTFEHFNFGPIWKPDDDKLTFTSCRGGRYDVYCKSEDMHSPEEEPLVTGERDRIATSWSPDGKVLLFTQNDPNTGRDIWHHSIEDSNDGKLPINTPYDEYGAVFSPDGNWIAYTTTKQEDSPEVYVASYPEGDVNRKISTGGGKHPVWSAVGNELFYRNGDKMMAVIIETEPELKVGDPNTLFEERYYTGGGLSYNISHDGQTFLMVKSSEEEVTQLMVVPNFFEELKRLVPAKNN